MLFDTPSAHTISAPRGPRRWPWVLAALVIVPLVIGYSFYSWGKTTYNTFNSLSVGADTQFAQIDDAVKRRADLVPNIVATVQGEANFEKDTLTAVINARARATSITMTPETLKDPEAMANFNRVQGELSGALSRLMVVSEQYPQLRANQAFKDLRTTLEGTENRISVARRNYNSAVGKYNEAIGDIPGILVANFAGFRKREFFRISETDRALPQVKF